MSKPIIALLIVLNLLLVVGVAWVLVGGRGEDIKSATTAVTVEDGKQHIRILARGGYKPKQVVAKANLPTSLEIETKGTYDCSSAVTIPRFKIRKNLPPSGVTTFEIPVEEVNGTVEIVCSMGMFRSQILFQ